MNQAARTLFHRPFGQNRVHRYDIATQSWMVLPIPSFSNNYANCCDALEYFPELNGLVWVRGNPGEVWLFSDGTQQWSRLGALPSGATWQQAEYIPVLQAVMFTIGGQFYLLSRAGHITPLRTLSPPSASFFLFGIRGVGKSTWAGQRFPNAPQGATEVDFLVRRGKSFVAVEVKTTTNPGRPHLADLRAITDLAGIKRRVLVQQRDGVTVNVDMCSACEHAWSMSKMVQIRNVPDAVHRTLKARAAVAGQSLSDYLLAEMARVAARPTREEILARIHARTRVRLKTPAAVVIRDERESA